MRYSTFWVAFCLSSFSIFSQSTETSLNQFKQIRKAISDTLNKTPIFVVTEDFPNSPTKKINYKLKVETLDMKYDVLSTNSLVSPFTAYILVRIQVKSNCSSGDIISSKVHYDFSNLQSAMENDNYKNCIDSPVRPFIFEEWCIGELRANYAYQGNEWVFLGLEMENSNKIQSGSVRRDLKKYGFESIFKVNLK